MASRATSDEAARIVRSAAMKLLADLDRGEHLTNHWTDEALGNVLVTVAIDRCLARLSDTGWWGRENQLLSSEFWRLAGPRLECGSMQVRARMKPRGYAGDFETLVLFDQHYECQHPLGRLFDRYFQNQVAVAAVRGRTEAVAAAIVDRFLVSAAGPFHIASIGCGPAIDLERAIRLLPAHERRRLQIQLFDLDEAALEYAGTRLGQWLAADQWSAHRENLFRLGQRPDHRQLLSQANFIFCTGLFDYLDDQPAAGLLGFLWRQVCPGGTLIVGNFSPHNPTRAYMEWIGNWYLLYRTPAQLAALADGAGVPPELFRVWHDPTGVDLLLIAGNILK